MQPKSRLAARPFDGDRVERSAAGKNADLRAGAESARFEIRQQPRIFLGLFGDAVNRGSIPGRQRGKRHSRRPPLRRCDIDRVAVGTSLRMAQELVEAYLDVLRDGSLEPVRLVIGL